MSCHIHYNFVQPGCLYYQFPYFVTLFGNGDEDNVFFPKLIHITMNIYRVYAVMNYELLYVIYIVEDSKK